MLGTSIKVTRATSVPKLYEHNCPFCNADKSHPVAATELPSEYTDEIQKAFNKTLKQLYNNEKPDNKMLITSGKTLAQTVEKNYSQIVTDWNTPDSEMLVRLTRDVWQFSAAKNYQELRDFTLALKDENGALREWDDYKEAASKIGKKYIETWMRTEYDQAISASTSAARWTDFEKNADIMPNLQYQTVGDAFVRESHQLLNGITRPMKDPFWNTHYPPNGWGCRCEALQVPNGLAPITPDKDIPKIDIAPMFLTNLAKTGLIFPKEHAYYKDIPRAELRKAMAYLPPENSYVTTKVADSKVEVHILHGDVEKKTGKSLEVEKSLKNCEILLKHDPEAKLKLLPIINEKELHLKDKFYPKEYIEKFGLKNADCLYNGKVVEFEEPNGKGNSISNSIKRGKDQSDFVILRVPDDVE